MNELQFTFCFMTCLCMGGGGGGVAGAPIIYKGYWNADTNIVTPGGTPLPAAVPANENWRYIVDVAGNTNIDGMADWDANDYITSTGALWYKTDNTPAVDGWIYIDANSNMTAVNKNSINADTSGGSFDIQLPATPSIGDKVRINDATEVFAFYSAFVYRNGNLINGQTEDWELNVFKTVTFVFVGGATGWNIEF